MNQNIKKLLKKMKADIIYRIVTCYPITNKLHLKNAFVVRKNLLESKNGKYYSTGNDCNIIIRFVKPISKFKIINDSANNIQLYYSNTNSINFNFDDERKIKSSENEQNISFEEPVYYIKLILSDRSEQLKLDKVKIIIDEKVEKMPKIDNSVGIKKIMSQTNKEKLIVVTHDMTNSGAPLLALNICKSLIAEGKEVAILALAEGPLARKYTELNIPILSLHQQAGYRRIKNPKTLKDIIDILYENGYRKVITNTIVAGVVVPLFKRKGFKVISLIHEMYNSIVSFNMEQGGKDINYFSDVVVFPDKTVQNDFELLFGKGCYRSIIQPQGLYAKPDGNFQKSSKSEILSKYKLPKNSKIILGSGIADLRKGVDLFINTIPLLCELEKEYEYHFIWIGEIIDKKLKNWLDLQLSKSKYKDRFHNFSFISDINEYMNLIANSDAFLLTSREDPFPSVMIEAITYSVPIFSFMGSGGADTLLDEGRGVLIPDFNINALATSINKVLFDKKMTEKITKDAKDYLDNCLDFGEYVKFLSDALNEQIKEKYVYGDYTVVVPNYNYQDYLHMRLWSIASQTLKPKKIIFLDDNSKDDSIKVAKSILKDINKKYSIDYEIVPNTENKGCFKQWLNGMKRAETEFLWIAEADDCCTYNMIETLYKQIKSDKEIALAYAQSIVIDENSTVIETDYKGYTDDLSKEHWANDFIADGITEASNYLSKKNTITNVSSVLFRCKFLENIDDVLNNYNIMGDWAAYIYLASLGKIAFSATSMNMHRRHSNSIIARTEKSQRWVKEYISIYELLIEKFNLDKRYTLNNLLTLYNDNPSIRNGYMLNEYNSLLKKVSKINKKGNVLIVIPDMDVGGGQTVSINIANNLTKKYDVFLINVRNTIVNPIIKDMISDKVGVLEINNSAETLKMITVTFEFKAVISFIWWSDKMTYMAVKDNKTNWIISMHGCYEMLLHHPEIDKFFEENISNMFNRANHIVYTADKNMEIFEKENIVGDKKIIKINNGFCLNSFSEKARQELEIKDDEFVFGLVARGIPEKGYAEAIEALNILNDNCKKKAHLILVGSSEYQKKLKSQHSENRYVHFIDKFSEPNEWLGWEKICDVMLLPTYFRSESLPTVIVESLFLEKPVIATNLGEIKSMLVTDKFTAGSVIDLIDGKVDTKKLANQMEKMMNDEKFYNLCKEGTKKAQKRFDMNECIDNYCKLIDKIDK